jgi:hypothetical protein
MLQVGGSRVQFQMSLLKFSSTNIILPAALGLTKPLTEMATRNALVCKVWQARKADNFTDICEQIV